MLRTAFHPHREEKGLHVPVLSGFQSLEPVFLPSFLSVQGHGLGSNGGHTFSM